jgi:hypothetical protein
VLVVARACGRILAALEREMTEEEAAEQWACERADDAAKLAREEAA